MKKLSSIMVTSMLLLSMVSVLIIGLAGCGETNVIKIGVIAELTGEMPAVGQSCVNSANLAAEEINDTGGIDIGGTKYTIKVVRKDDNADPEKAAVAARELIDTEKVSAIIGPNASSGAVEAGKVANEKGVMLITPWSTSPKTTVDDKTGKPLETVYRACFTDNFESEALGRFAAVDLESIRAAILYSSSTEVLKDQAELFKNSYEKNGGAIVAVETYKEGDKDYSAQLDKIKAASPDLIFLPSYYKDAARQAKQIRDKGIEARLLGSDAWSTPDLIKAAGSDVDGAYVFNHYSAELPDSRTKKFVDRYKSKYNSTPDDVAALTYDSFGLLKKALEGAEKLDNRSLLKSMKNVTEFEGVTGPLDFKGGSHDPVKDGVILQISNGKFKFSSVVYVEPGREDVVSFVKEAAGYIEKNGKEKALAEFNDPNGSFQRGELYMFAYDMDGNTLALGNDPSLVGTNRIEYKDADGLPVIQELIAIARQGEGWLSYQYENPETKRQQKKSSYVQKIDDTWFIGSGLYE